MNWNSLNTLRLIHNVATAISEIMTPDRHLLEAKEPL
jgi:hypothetical protein